MVFTDLVNLPDFSSGKLSRYTRIMLSHFYKTTSIPAMKKHGIAGGCALFF